MPNLFRLMAAAACSEAFAVNLFYAFLLHSLLSCLSPSAHLLGACPCFQTGWCMRTKYGCQVSFSSLYCLGIKWVPTRLRQLMVARLGRLVGRKGFQMRVILRLDVGNTLHFLTAVADLIPWCSRGAAHSTPNVVGCGTHRGKLFRSFRGDTRSLSSVFDRK